MRSHDGSKAKVIDQVSAMIVSDPGGRLRRVSDWWVRITSNLMTEPWVRNPGKRCSGDAGQGCEIWMKLRIPPTCQSNKS